MYLSKLAIFHLYMVYLFFHGKISTKRHNFSSKKTSRTSRKWVIYFQGGGWCAPNWLAHLDGYSILDANQQPLPVMGIGVA